MSAVHVLVSNRAEDEHAYAAAFAGVAQVYRFASNVEAFERLASAAAPVAVLVVTEHQDSLFNMSADQLVERLIDSPLGRSAMLGQLRIVVVGRLSHGRERAVSVSSLRGALEYLKYGKVERTHRVEAGAPPQLQLRPRDGAPAAEPVPSGGGGFADSVISSIWQSADASASRPRRAKRPGRAKTRAASPARPAAVVGGGANGGTSLFVSPQAPTAEPQAGAQHDMHAPQQPAMQSGALQPALPVNVPSAGQYRGPNPRYLMAHGVNVAEGSAQAPQSHLPPELATQVRHLVYPGGASADPVMGWSSATQRQLHASNVSGGGPASPQHAPAADASMSFSGHRSAMPAAAGVPHRPAQHAGAVQQTMGLIQQRVVAAERAPLVPTGVGRTTPVTTFEAPADLLDRSDRLGDVSFG